MSVHVIGYITTKRIEYKSFLKKAFILPLDCVLYAFTAAVISVPRENIIATVFNTVLKNSGICVYIQFREE